MVYYFQEYFTKLKLLDFYLFENNLPLASAATIHYTGGNSSVTGNLGSLPLGENTAFRISFCHPKT